VAKLDKAVPPIVPNPVEIPYPIALPNLESPIAAVMPFPR